MPHAVGTCAVGAYPCHGPAAGASCIHSRGAHKHPGVLLQRLASLTRRAQFPKVIRSNRPLLVVEDNDALRMALKDLFAPRCGSVVLARDGREALDLVDSGLVPCVVITDLEMPRMGGIELIEALAGRGLGDVPVITMSGSRFTQRDGAHLRKPFAWEDVVRAVQTCAGGECTICEIERAATPVPPTAVAS